MVGDEQQALSLAGEAQCVASRTAPLADGANRPTAAGAIATKTERPSKSQRKRTSRRQKRWISRLRVVELGASFNGWCGRASILAAAEGLDACNPDAGVDVVQRKLASACGEKDGAGDTEAGIQSAMDVCNTGVVVGRLAEGVDGPFESWERWDVSEGIECIGFALVAGAGRCVACSVVAGTSPLAES